MHPSLAAGRNSAPTATKYHQYTGTGQTLAQKRVGKKNLKCLRQFFISPFTKKQLDQLLAAKI